jgi:SAM-dependent methyltransferase
MPMRFLLVLVLAVSAPLAAAQAQKKPADEYYQPSIGQDGKDVVWVPTPQVVVDKMLDMAKVTPQDFVMDLGSGDGRTVITAAKRGARALGIEYNPDMVALSRRNAAKAGVAEKAKFRKADLFATDFSQATVITMFLLPDINLKLRPQILKLRPGTRIASNTFTMGEWQADQTENLSTHPECKASYCTALLWIVPAQVAGTHKLGDGEVTLKQDFQYLSGTLRAGGRTVPVEGGKVEGESFSFVAGGREYKGRKRGEAIEWSN